MYVLSSEKNFLKLIYHANYKFTLFFRLFWQKKLLLLFHCCDTIITRPYNAVAVNYVDGMWILFCKWIQSLWYCVWSWCECDHVGISIWCEKNMHIFQSRPNKVYIFTLMVLFSLDGLHLKKNMCVARKYLEFTHCSN